MDTDDLVVTECDIENGYLAYQVAVVCTLCQLHEWRNSLPDISEDEMKGIWNTHRRLPCTCNKEG